MIQKVTKKGFTIIEMMLSMAIVSFLILTIGIMTMQMVSMMNKGTTLRDLNVASRSISTDFSQTFNSIASAHFWGNNGYEPTAGTSSDTSYIQVDKKAGAFCTGDVTYLWNNAEELNKKSIERDVQIRFDGAQRSDDSIRLIKVNDRTKSYCQDRSLWTKIKKGQDVIEILSPGEIGMMLYDIRFHSSDALFDSQSNQRVINISYVLGTQSSRGEINTVNAACNVKAGDYCAINKFELTVRTLGKR